MKQLLLTIALFYQLTANLNAQCLPPENFCADATLYCGFYLQNQFQGSTIGYQPAGVLASYCGTYENTQYLKFVPCSGYVTVTAIPSNCANNNGIQLALLEDCDASQFLDCDGGQAGGGSMPVSVSSPVIAGEVYILMIDGYAGDQCDFTLDLQGVDVALPSSGQNAQNGYIEYNALPCGPATLTAHLPYCTSSTSGGCSFSWAGFYDQNCLGVQWNLPPGVQITSPDPNALTITVNFTQSVLNGQVSIGGFVHTCPVIEPGICDVCIPSCSGGIIPPIFISGNPPTYAYQPCSAAPVICTGSVNTVTISTDCTFSGFGWWNQLNLDPNNPDADFCFPLESPNIYELSACNGNLDLDISVQNCLNHRGLEFAFLSGDDCNSLELQGACISIPEGQSGQMSASIFGWGNYEDYYLVVDGINLDACDFTITATPGNANDDLEITPSYNNITGQNAVCPGQVLNYQLFVPPVNAIYNGCFPPTGECKFLDSLTIEWQLPPFMHFIDSIGEDITVMVDSSYLGNETYLDGEIAAVVKTVGIPYPGSQFCNCEDYVASVITFPKFVFLQHHVQEIPLALSCQQPCKSYNSVPYCNPGTFIASQTACVTQKVVVTAPPFPAISAPTIQVNDSTYTVSFSVNPYTGVIVTGGNGTFQNGIFTSGPIYCGEAYEFKVDSAGCIQSVAGSAPCYLPPSCAAFNIPVPLADSCANAPLLCGNYLENYCSTTAGLTPDQPGYTTDSLPDFENNGWLRITPCSDSIAIDFQVFDCQTGNELGFFLLSGDCDTMTPLVFASATEGNTAHLEATGLTSGDIYYLAIDGFYNAECKFQIHVADGIGTASPASVTCNCVNSYIEGPADICPGDVAAYYIVPGYCDAPVITPGTGGNGMFCAPPDSACLPNGRDSIVTHWVIPSYMSYLSDSVNVPTILTLADTSLIGVDTVMHGTVSVWYEVIHIPDTTDQEPIFCDCIGGCIPGLDPKDVTLRHKVKKIYGTLTCNEPCFYYNGQSYCTPGLYIVEKTNCLTRYLILTSNIDIPIADAGTDKTICPGESTTIGSNNTSGGSVFTYNWSNGSTTQLTVVSPPVTTQYILLVTNTANGCTDEDQVTVNVVPGFDTDWGVVGVLTCANPYVVFPGNGIAYNQAGSYTVPKPAGCGNDKFVILQNTTAPSATASASQPIICLGDEVSLTANSNFPGAVYHWSNNAQGSQFTVTPPGSTVYTVTVTNPANGCTGTATAPVTVKPPIFTNLPPKTICEGDCITIIGEVFCPTSSGYYSFVGQSYLGCDSTVSFAVTVIPVTPADQGVVGTITCKKPYVAYLGEPYTQPGTYTATAPGGCSIYMFTIASDLTPPTVDAGLPQTICNGESVLLQATSSASNAQFLWSNAVSGSQNPVAPVVPTTYTVTVTNETNGCTATDAVTLNVLDAVPPTVLVPVSVCAGDCVEIAGETVCPTSSGNYSVTATSQTGCDSVIHQEITILPVANTNHGIVGTLNCLTPEVSFMGVDYTAPGSYTVADPGGCGQHTFTVAMDVVAPDLTLIAPPAICQGEPATLLAESGTQGVEFVWNNNAGGASLNVSPTTTTTYAVTATNPANGCSVDAEVTVAVNVPENTNLGVIGTLDCNHPEIVFQGNIYSQAGQYTVPKPGGCGTDQFIILANITPPWCPILPVPALCAGESATLETAPPFPPNLQYLWSTGETTQAITINPQTTTTYTVTATDPATGCYSLVSTTVEVMQPQLVQLGTVGVLTCAQPCFTYNGQEYCQPGTYNYTSDCEIREFVIGQDLSLPTVQLGLVGTLTCAQPCITYNGQEYCQPGTYNYTSDCEIREFVIGQDLSLPTVQLGTVGVLTCAQPCFTYNGQEYCQPGTYNYTSDCEIKEFVIGQDLSLPTVQLGTVGTLTCAQPCFTYNGQEYCQPGTYNYTSDCEIKEFVIGQDLSLPTVQLGLVGVLTCAQPCFTYNGQEYCQPGTYNYTSDCEIREFVIGQDLSLPTVQLGLVGVLTCAQPCFTYNGQEYCQPGTYNYTSDCEIKEFVIGQDLSLPTVQLGLVGVLTCAQPCFTYNGQEYCQPGTYNYTSDCEIKEFVIGQDLSLPTVQLGLVGTLTCAQPCFTYNGQEYCQPGTYNYTSDCEIKEFVIGQDLSLPTVQLGTVGVLTCAQPCYTYNGQEYCQPGTYSLVKDCETQQFVIGDLPPVYLDLGEDQTIAAGESVEINSETNAQPANINWYSSTGPLSGNDLTITVQPLENTLYSLQIHDINGCLVEDSVWVYLKKAEGGWYAPNVIQPEAGNVNAWFTLFSGDDYVAEIQLLEIFDRWGDKVFTRKNFPPNAPESGWDGATRGKILVPAVFVWHADLLLRDGTVKKVKGDVTVLR